MSDRKIKNEPDTGYRLVGIASSLREYKLCYHLNRLLACDFRKLKDIVFEPTDRTRKIQFSVFKGGEEGDKNQFLVFSNKNLGEFLLPEVSNFDYVIRVQQKISDEELKHLMEGIKQFPEVMMSAEIPLKKIKSKDRLTYEEEKEARKLLHPKRFK